MCPTDRTSTTYYYSGAGGAATVPAAGTSSYAMVMGTVSAHDGSGNSLLRPAAPPSGSNPLSTVGQLDVRYNNNGMFMYRVSHYSRDVTDGMGNTIFVGETINGSRFNVSSNAGSSSGSGSPTYHASLPNRWAVAWYQQDSLRAVNPIAWNLSSSGTLATSDAPINNRNPATHQPVADGFASSHPGGANFAFGDGSVRFLPQNIDWLTMQALATIAGGEVVDPTAYTR
jgi:prepilin-type processing-associated H-X9-DG protein